MMAAVYAAGRDGMRNRIEPEHLIHGEEAYARTALPALRGPLAEALRALQEDEAIVEPLGPSFISTYCALKGNEVKRFGDHVTDWEVDAYLELF
jgi:glutamine synthetase